MKKTIAFALALIISLTSICSCNSETPRENTENTNGNNGPNEINNVKTPSAPSTLVYDYSLCEGPLLIALDECGNYYVSVAEWYLSGKHNYRLPETPPDTYFHTCLNAESAWLMYYNKSEGDSTLNELIFYKLTYNSPSIETYTHTVEMENLCKINYGFYNTTDGFLFLWSTSETAGNSLCFKTNDCGKTWDRVNIEFPEVLDSSQGYPNLVQFVSDKIGLINYAYHSKWDEDSNGHRGDWTDTFDRTYLTTDGGSTWNRISLNAPVPIEYIEWWQVDYFRKDGESYVFHTQSSIGGYIFSSNNLVDWITLDGK